MNPTTPTEVQVITEMDVYEASVRKVVSRGNLNASPLAEPSYSWSDVEAEEQSNIQKSAFTENVNEQLNKLMTEVEDIVHKENIKVDVKLESDKNMAELGDSEDDMPELGDSEDDMPDLVDSESDMPDLVSDDDMPELVEESDSDSENDELMIAVFKRPSCPRCEAALKILLDHEENVEDESVSEEEHTYDERESSESDDSDSDYVPSDSESESPRTVRQLRRWNMATQTEEKRTACVPPLIQFIAIVLFVIHVLKFLLNEPSQRIRCYS